jgi:hypothetical protein
MGRLRPADVLAGIGGAVLLGSLWLKWYGLDARALIRGGDSKRGALNVLDTFSTPDLSAWQAFSAIDILLAVAALLAIGVPISSALARSPAKPVAFALLASVAGFVAVLLVLFRIVDQPGSNALITVKSGAWIGMAGAVLALVGSSLALADDSTPGATPPQVPRRRVPSTNS